MYNSVRSTLSKMVQCTLTLGKPSKMSQNPGEGVLKQVHVTEKKHRDRGSDLDLDQCLTKQTKSFNWF